MRRFSPTFLCSCLFVVVSSLPICGAAQETPPTGLSQVAEQLKALQEMVRGLQETVAGQQSQIDVLKNENEQLRGQMAPAAPVPAPSPAAAAAPTAGGAKGALSILPEIGAFVDITETLSQRQDDEEGNDRLSVRELELILGGDVDPFTRFDATVTFSDFEEAAIEEAYITYLGLPYELVVKGGRLRPKIGKASALHRDQLDTADEPLVVERYLGLEGFAKTGVEISRFLPQFADPLTQELTLGLLEGGAGEDGQMFGETRRRPTVYAHLKNYWEPSDVTNLELGATWLRGSADPDARDEVNALGLDLTLTHFFTPVNRLKWQSELYYQDRRETGALNRGVALTNLNTFVGDVGRFIGNAHALAGGEAPELALPDTLAAAFTRYAENPWGFYSLIDYRLSPRFGTGLRYDYVEPVTYLRWRGDDADQALSAYLTFYQSEFARLRLQYQHVDSGQGADDNRVYLQAGFAAGTHKHQLK